MADGRLLLDLPPELRIHIYELLLKIPIIPASPLCGPGPFGQTAQSELPDPAILATCWRINAEAAPVFYSSNTFCFGSGTRAHVFLQALTPRSLALLRTLEFHLYRVIFLEEQDWIKACVILTPDITGTDADATTAPQLALKTLRLEFMSGSWPENAPEGVDRNDFAARNEWWGSRVIMARSGVFIHAVACIHHLETLELGGYYPQNWAFFLRVRMGAKTKIVAGGVDPPSPAGEEMGMNRAMIRLRIETETRGAGGKEHCGGVGEGGDSGGGELVYLPLGDYAESIVRHHRRFTRRLWP